MRSFATVRLAAALALALAASARAEDPAPPDDDHSLTEINKGLTNPVSDLWSITFQQNNYRVDVGPSLGEHWNSNLNFQPVLPLSISDDWNVITRPVMTLVNSVPHPDPNDVPPDIDRTTDFGDIVWLELLSPSPRLAGNWILGAGPTFIFPSASSRWTGQGKWQVGPSVVVGYLSDKWIAGAFLQQWFSFAGNSSRESVSQMNLQPFASYFLPGGWSVGYSGNILANWEAGSDNTWTVPIGVNGARS